MERRKQEFFPAHQTIAFSRGSGISPFNDAGIVAIMPRHRGIAS